jgi:hypothetical protein
MRDWWAGLWKDAWLAGALSVGLMSGIASIFREWLTISHPGTSNTGHVFDTTLRLCFAIACGVVIVRQRSTIVLLERRERQASDTKTESLRLHEQFGNLMNEGEALADELRRGVQHIGRWLKKRSDWISQVSKALTDAGWPTDAAAFRQAVEMAPEIKGVGVVDHRYSQQFYGQQLDNCRTKLAEIVARKLQ